jgi:hypothetical protein
MELCTTYSMGFEVGNAQLDMWTGRLPTHLWNLHLNDI